MLKKKYYCLIAGLPDLFFNENKPGFSSLEFRNQLQDQLDLPDFELVELLFFHHDNENVLNILFEKNKPFNPNGIFPKYFLEPDLENPIELPVYMNQYIQWFNKQELKELNTSAENYLYSLFYEFVLKVKNEFIREWFAFEMNIKNILTAINCKHFNYNPEQQLIHSGTDSTIYNLLKNTQLKPELFEEEIPFAEQIFRIAMSESNVIEKEKAIDKIKWNYLYDRTFFHYFTIEKILSFVIKLQITERWLKLDTKTGKELLNKLIDELKTSYKFPAEFSIIK